MARAVAQKRPAIGQRIRSGSQSALVYEALREEGVEREAVRAPEADRHVAGHMLAAHAPVGDGVMELVQPLDRKAESPSGPGLKGRLRLATGLNDRLGCDKRIVRDRQAVQPQGRAQPRAPHGCGRDRVRYLPRVTRSA